MQLESIDFAPITIFYGSNGCGKSTLLNIIAESVGVQDKTLGNTNEYFSAYTRECTYTDNRIPEDSMMIRSEDIMEQIAIIRKKNAATDKMVKGWFRKGSDEEDSLRREMDVQEKFENIFDCGNDQNSFYCHVRKTLSEKFEEGSNGETAIKYFKDKLWPDNLYFLDEPENSMSPAFQQELAAYITFLAYRMNTQFIIASHSPFMLSMEGARIYDLDSHPSCVKEWFQLENMKAYYQLFKRYEKRFDK
jgi:predicted ATPase